MPYNNPKHKTRSQRKRRRAGRVRRLEVTLSADSERDHDISDYLDSLPPGSAAEFIRQALAEKIQRENAQPEAQPTHDHQPAPAAAPSAQIDQLFAELDHQRREATEQIAALYQELADEKHHASRQIETMITELVELRHAIHQPAPVAATAEHHETAQSSAPGPTPKPPPSLPESPATVRSSGIDTSRPRPRPAPRKTPPAPPVDNEPLSEQDAIRLAKIMANSIKRAQPGRAGQR